MANWRNLLQISLTSESIARDRPSIEEMGRPIFRELIAMAASLEVTSAREISLTTTPHSSTASARITPGRIPAVIGGVRH